MGGIKTGWLMPSWFQRGSYWPGPQLFKTASVSGQFARPGASAMMAPGLRSRLAAPSMRTPMPGITESLTSEWQSAQVIPTLVRMPCRLTRALHAHDGVEPDERDGRRRLVEVRRFENSLGQRLSVDLEPER